MPHEVASLTNDLFAKRLGNLKPSFEIQLWEHPINGVGYIGCYIK